MSEDRWTDPGRLDRIENKLDRIDEKLDTVVSSLPTYVTWGKLGAAVIAAATLTLAVIGVGA